MYIYVYTYTYIYIYSFMCATDCGKRIYFMLSGWFSSSLGPLFLARLRFCVHYCIDSDTVKKKTAGFLTLSE